MKSWTDSKEKVLSSLGVAASNLRQKLGESLSSIQKFDVPIEQATTSSLEALKAYSMGDDERQKGHMQESVNFYQRAVQLDPNFAMAYARIGVFYANQSQIEQAKEYVQKAYDLKERVSEKERLYISEKYYGYSTGELDKAIEVLQQWARLYPKDFTPHNNLSLNYQYFGRWDDALKEAMVAVRLNPNSPIAKDNLIQSFAGLGRIDEAKQATDELAKNSPDYVASHFFYFFLGFLRGDQTAMENEMRWAQGKPQEADMLLTASGVAFYEGKLKKGEDLIHRAAGLFRNQDRKENESQALINLATTQAGVGRCQEAKESVKQGLAASRSRISLGLAAMAMAVCQDQPQAESLLNEVVGRYPKDTPIVAMLAPLVRASFAANKGNSVEGQQLLEGVRGYDLEMITGLVNPYARGLLNLQQRKGPEAAAEFQTIIDHRTIDPTSISHPLAQLGLARASAMNGDTAKSRHAYQDFMALWKDADQDLIPLVQAKKEYEQLK